MKMAKMRVEKTKIFSNKLKFIIQEMNM